MMIASPSEHPRSAQRALAHRYGQPTADPKGPLPPGERPARYLCGGGCHHEVIARGRPACDYIRGWLHYCLQAYVRLSSRHANLFDRAPPSEVVVG
jgi:hypothetical protein